MPGVAVPARRQLRWAVERRLCWPVGSDVWSDRREGRSPDRRADQTTGGDLFPLLSGGRSGLWRAVVSEHSSKNERWVCVAGPPHFRTAGISFHYPSSPTNPKPENSRVGKEGVSKSRSRGAP